MAIRADRVGVRQDQVDIHGRVTSPSFLNELLEDLPEWTDMPVRVNGTEELLPSNNSVPVTSPILADIVYPDIRRDNQYFTYRESPTPVDGLAKIKSIKGNTLVWNQLVQNGNFESTSGWSTVRGTISTSNNILSYSVTELGGGGLQNRIVQNISIPANHKVFYSLNINPPKAFSVIMNIGGEFTAKETAVPNTWNLCSGIMTLSSAMTDFRFGCPSNVGNMAVGDVIQFKNVMLIDLTKMGLDSITDPSDFTSLFPLSYYSYNQGSLLSFNGNGIKTVGKNIFDGVLQNGTIDQYGQEQSQANRYRSGFIRVFPSTRYVLSVDGVIKNVNIFYYDINKNFISSIGGSLVTTPSNCAYMRFYYDQSIFNVNLQLEMLKSGDRPTPYEPYTSSTSSLPISTYFPTGMKSAEDVYDELTPTKAITRIGAVDLGSLEWSYNTTYGMYTTGISELVKKPSASNVKVNAISTVGTLTDWATFFASGTSSGLWAINTGGYLGIATTETNSTTFKNSLQGVYLYYELATPVELPTMSFE